MTKLIHQYIDGARSDTAEGAAAELINPATGEVTGAVEQGTEADVDLAVAAARRAFGLSLAPGQRSAPRSLERSRPSTSGAARTWRSR